MIYATIYTLVFIFRVVIMYIYFILCLFIRSISNYNQIHKMDVNSGWISKTPLEEKRIIHFHRVHLHWQFSNISYKVTLFTFTCIDFRNTTFSSSRNLVNYLQIAKDKFKYHSTKGIINFRGRIWFFTKISDWNQWIIERMKSYFIQLLAVILLHHQAALPQALRHIGPLLEV